MAIGDHGDFVFLAITGSAVGFGMKSHLKSRIKQNKRNRKCLRVKIHSFVEISVSIHLLYHQFLACTHPCIIPPPSPQLML